MPDDENYQINQHPWLVLTVITPSQAPDTDVMSLSRSNVQCGPPGLPRADPTQAVVAGRSLSGRNYNSPPHRLSTLHWEHYPHRILRHYWCLCLALTSKQPLMHMYSIFKVSTFQSSLIISSVKMSPSWWEIIKLRQVSPAATHTHCSPQNFDALCFAACLSFIITPGIYLRQPLNFPSKDQICLILKLNFHVPTTASLAAHWGKHNYVRLSTVSCDQSVSIPQLVFIGPIF